MRIMKKILYILAVAGVLFSSCSKDGSMPTRSDNALTISSSIATRASGTEWDDNDQIGVFASQGAEVYGDNVLYSTPTGGASVHFTASAEPIYYPHTGVLDIVAYYPYVESTTLTAYAVDVTEQSKPEDIDLLSAKISSQKSSMALNMDFHHRLSQVSITLKAGEGLTTADLAGTTVSVSGVVATASYDLQSDHITLGSAKEDISLNVTADGTQATGIVIPQSATDVSLLFDVPSYGILSTAINLLEFEAGKNHIFTVTVSEYELNLSDATIVAWDEDTEIGDDNLTADEARTIAQIIARPPTTNPWRIKTGDAPALGELDALYELLDEVSYNVDIIFVDAKRLEATSGGGETRAAMLRSVSAPALTEVGDYAFINLPALESVSLPNVTTVGYGAFADCSQLTEISLPKATRLDVFVFHSCYALETVSLPKVTEIENHTFQECVALKTIHLPEATTIGDGAFVRCSALEEVSLPKVTELGIGAFQRCTALKYVSLPELLEVAEYTFTYCEALETILLSKATIIGRQAFVGSPLLKDVYLPEAISIGYAAFYQCYALDELSLPDATTIEDHAFAYCTALTNVSLPEAITIGYGAFILNAFETISLPKATTLGAFAFENCTAMTSISLPEVTNIGNNAFNDCTALPELSLPKAIKIEHDAFPRCNALTELSIGTGYTAEPAAADIDINASVFDHAPLSQINLTVGYGEVSGKYWTPEVGGTRFGEFASVTK